MKNGSNFPFCPFLGQKVTFPFWQLKRELEAKKETLYNCMGEEKNNSASFFSPDRFTDVFSFRERKRMTNKDEKKHLSLKAHFH